MPGLAEAVTKRIFVNSTIHPTSHRRQHDFNHKTTFHHFHSGPSPKTNQLRICSYWLFVMFISNHSFALFAVPGLAGYMQCSARLLVWECGNENNTGRGRQPKIVNVISFHQHLSSEFNFFCDCFPIWGLVSDYLVGQQPQSVRWNIWQEQ